MTQENEDIRQAVRDIARTQSEFYGLVYTELSAVKEATAKMTVCLEHLSSRIEDHIVEDQKVAAIVRVLEGVEDRRTERKRVAMLAAKGFGWLIGIATALVALATALLGAAKAIARWVSP